MAKMLPSMSTSIHRAKLMCTTLHNIQPIVFKNLTWTSYQTLALQSRKLRHRSCVLPQILLPLDIKISQKHHKLGKQCCLLHRQQTARTKGYGNYLLVCLSYLVSRFSWPKVSPQICLQYHKIQKVNTMLSIKTRTQVKKPPKELCEHLAMESH